MSISIELDIAAYRYIASSDFTDFYKVTRGCAFLVLLSTTDVSSLCTSSPMPRVVIVMHIAMFEYSVKQIVCWRYSIDILISRSVPFCLTQDIFLVTLYRDQEH